MLEAQNRAKAKAALAEAEKIEAEQRAALEAPAKAEKAQVIVDAEAEAEKRKLEAEGAGRGDLRQARSRGPRPVRDPRQEGRRPQAIIDACGGAQDAFQLLMLEHLDTLAEASARPSRTSSSTRSSSGKAAANGTVEHRQLPAEHGPIMPPMMQVMKDVGGVEVPEYVAKSHRRRSAGRQQAPASASPNGAVPAAVGGEGDRPV